VKSGNIRVGRNGQRSAAKLLTKDEARRIAANIAKLPDLLQEALSCWKLARAPPSGSHRWVNCLTIVF
jgi:hypothetical protein